MAATLTFSGNLSSADNLMESTTPAEPSRSRTVAAVVVLAALAVALAAWWGVQQSSRIQVDEIFLDKPRLFFGQFTHCLPLLTRALGLFLGFAEGFLVALPVALAEAFRVGFNSTVVFGAQCSG